MAHIKKLGFATKVLIGMLLGAVCGLIIGPEIACIGFIGTIFSDCCAALSFL